MANIGATTAFYKVETSLTRANNEVSKSMERLATGKQNANAGDRSSYVAMSDTFRLDYVGTKAGIKGATVAMGYLETGMRVIDSASALLSRLQELAVLGANNTNTTADNEAINLEAEALADEFNRLMTTSTYKGKDVFVSAAGDQEIAMGGRGQEMSFGIGRLSYSGLYSAARTIPDDPNATESFNLAHLPSDAITAKSYGGAVTQNDAESSTVALTSGKKYVIRGINTTDEVDMSDTTNELSAASLTTPLTDSQISMSTSAGTAITGATTLASGMVIDVATDTTVARALASGGIITKSVPSDADGAVVDYSITANPTDALRDVVDLSGISASSEGTASGSGATWDVITAADGTATITLVDGGADYAAGDTFTFADSLFGTNGGAAITVTIGAGGVTNQLDRGANKTTLITDADYTVTRGGNVITSASGATFTVTTNSAGSATVTQTYGGTGFQVNDIITINGSSFTGQSGNPSDLSITVTTAVGDTATGTSVKFAEVRTDENAFKATETYVIQSLGTANLTGSISVSDSDAEVISKAFTDVNGAALSGNLSVGQKIKFATLGDTIGTTVVTQEHLDAANALIEGMTFTMSSDTLTTDIETIQALLNRARVEAGSQYAAMESAVSYTTDLTAQYELGFNTVNDVNFSSETAHLAKNQILQQAATAMLAQANSGQQGLLQLIQG